MDLKKETHQYHKFRYDIIYVHTRINICAIQKNISFFNIFHYNQFTNHRSFFAF